LSLTESALKDNISEIIACSACSIINVIRRKGDEMNEDDIRREIESELSKQNKRVVNKNAIDALFSAFPGPIQALGKVLFGREEAIEKVKQRITIETILQLLLKIDRVISDNNGKTDGIDWKVVGGDIEAYGENAREVTGMDISYDA